MQIRLKKQKKRVRISFKEFHIIYEWISLPWGCAIKYTTIEYVLCWNGSTDVKNGEWWNEQIFNELQSVEHMTDSFNIHYFFCCIYCRWFNMPTTWKKSTKPNQKWKINEFLCQLQTVFVYPKRFSFLLHDKKKLTLIRLVSNFKKMTNEFYCDWNIGNGN